jgi:hypothetical protein
MDCECGGLAKTWSDEPRLDNSHYLYGEATDKMQRKQRNLGCISINLECQLLKRLIKCFRNLDANGIC